MLSPVTLDPNAASTESLALLQSITHIRIYAIMNNKRARIKKSVIYLEYKMSIGVFWTNEWLSVFVDEALH